jgi:hypothetical protein
MFLFVSLLALSLAGCASRTSTVRVASTPVETAPAPVVAAPQPPADDVRDCAGSFNRVWRATLASMEDAGYAVPSELTTSATEGELQVNDASVSAWQVEEGLTRVSVRVGSLATDAERQTADRIHDGIASRVSTP